MKLKHILLVAVLIFAFTGYFAIENILHESHYKLSQREVMLREIGHEILLHSGDSTSRVLPVQKLGNDEYELRFEKQFTFEPDTLVNIVRKSLAPNSENRDYTVNIRECSGWASVYGYTVSSKGENEIIPCKGREYPSGCYAVNIQFRNADTAIGKYAAAGTLLAITLLFPALLFHYRKKKPVRIETRATENSIQIGSFTFDINRKCLTSETATISLTAKETKLLAIFAQNLNQVVDRARLQKEIWEDDGIIVGRSLDVFISKLRKKLEPDASVQLINIHGKGYKLQIEKPLS